MLQSSSAVAYSGAAVGNASPSMLSAGGFHLKLGDSTVGGVFVGYAGSSYSSAAPRCYIPNTFTPNNDSRNDVWLVYRYIIRSMRTTIFNQWGQKIFESSSQQLGWDGSYKGK